MGRERERFWEYAEDLSGHFLCKFCERRFSGGITRIKSHLSGNRGRGIEICPKVPEDVQLAALQAIAASMKETRSLISLNNEGENEVALASLSNKKAMNLHQGTILRKSNKDKSVVDKKLAKFIIANDLSPDLSNSPYLIDLLKGMAEIGPSYKIPNSLAILTQLCPDIFDETEEHIRIVKKCSITTGCTLVLSNVVENAKLVCINMFLYTPAGLVYIEKIAVPEEGLTFNNFIDGIYSAIESLRPDNVVQCIINVADDIIVKSITDFTDDNFFKSVQAMILREYPCIILIGCASREFALVLVLIYLTVPWIHKTTQLAIMIYRFLLKHDIKLPPAKQHARNKEYSFAGQTKIAIEVFALNSILEVETDLKALQLPIASGSYEGTSSEEDATDIVYKAIKSNEFWSRGKKVVKVLQPLLKVLDIIDDNWSNLGYLYEAMKRAEEAVEQQCDDDDRVHYEAIKRIFKKWRSRVRHPIHAAAAFLNPAYFCSENFTEDAEMHKGLDLLTLLLPDKEGDAFSKQLQLYRMKMSNLFTNTSMEMLKKIHPRKWWECFGDQYPVLQNVAIRILSQTCAAPICRFCNFEPIDEFDTLRMNTIMMRHFRSKLKSPDWEPIDLDRTSGVPEYAHGIVKEYLKKKYWFDSSDYHDLLAIDNNPNNRLFPPSESNAYDDWAEVAELSDDWLVNLRELGNLDDMIHIDELE